jgi:hypothetical protein
VYVHNSARHPKHKRLTAEQTPPNSIVTNEGRGRVA